MKKIISIIIVVLFFVFSILIFWSALSPVTFLNIFRSYSIVDKTIDKLSAINPQIEESALATSSEPVSSQKGQITLGNNTWQVEIVDNDIARVNGLSNRKTLSLDHGMLFVFDSMSKQSFWMKDMIFSIDMIFFDSDWRVVEIESNLSPSSFPKIFGQNVKSQYVLEINAGQAINQGLKLNDRAIFVNK